MEVTVSYSLILKQIYLVKVKNSKTKVYALGLGNIPKDFTYNNIKKKKKKKKEKQD